MAKRKVAGKTEILECLTEIMRSEENAKKAETMKAAELIGKHLGMFGEKKETGVKVVIVDDIPEAPERRKYGDTKK